MELEKLSTQPEDINTKKPNKSKVDIWKVLGVDFYQDYILPSNPQSKVKKFREWSNGTRKFYDLSEGYEAKIFSSWIWLTLHGIGCYEFLISSDKNIVFHIINVIGNLYPMLVQIRSISRINKIMKYKDLKIKLPQKIDIND